MHSVDPAESKEILTRLKTTRGHISGVERMIEEDKTCEEILVQLLAIRSSIQKVSAVVAQRYANTCLVDALENGENQQEILNKAIETIMKLSQ
ncbi:copper-sensing transcriptional repressor CsoR [Peptococcaceae bacterium CEB3]|nr:copper-sensing transcriptional repressor CsoR [Peptococcaceae bacterium CEB3]